MSLSLIKFGYAVSSSGKVYSPRGQELVPFQRPGDSAWYVTLRTHCGQQLRRLRLHIGRAVLMHLGGSGGRGSRPWENADGPEADPRNWRVHYRDGDRRNNTLGNLAWRCRLVKKAMSPAWDRAVSHAKLTVVQVAEIMRHRGYQTARTLARLFKVSKQHIRDIWKGRYWAKRLEKHRMNEVKLNLGGQILNALESVHRYRYGNEQFYWNRQAGMARNKDFSKLVMIGEHLLDEGIDAYEYVTWLYKRQEFITSRKNPGASPEDLKVINGKTRLFGGVVGSTKTLEKFKKARQGKYYKSPYIDSAFIKHQLWTGTERLKALADRDLLDPFYALARYWVQMPAVYLAVSHPFAALMAGGNICAAYAPGLVEQVRLWANRLDVEGTAKTYFDELESYAHIMVPDVQFNQFGLPPSKKPNTSRQ